MARVLIIAGSDSGGGAGIQGDIKTVQALGGYAMTAITALTAQNTQGVFGIHPVPPAFIAQQMTLCLEDIGADAIKQSGVVTLQDALNQMPGFTVGGNAGTGEFFTIQLHIARQTGSGRPAFRQRRVHQGAGV